MKLIRRRSQLKLSYWFGNPLILFYRLSWICFKVFYFCSLEISIIFIRFQNFPKRIFSKFLLFSVNWWFLQYDVSLSFEVWFRSNLITSHPDKIVITWTEFFCFVLHIKKTVIVAKIITFFVNIWNIRHC